ncbi:DUF2971 domain-containing protein [Thalassovita mediterranea]|jgi:hypothetical protein|nr:DUF2971 domain-containing protein [Thalassovita mediterranea]
MNFDCADELDQPIYRIMKEEHVLKMFEDRRSAMSKVENWKDNFENFLMKCGRERSGGRHDDTVRQGIVAQCWTKEIYSEAMWGIYANDRNTRFLRIRSTPRKLLEALRCAKPNLEKELCRIGKVEYKKTNEIRRWYYRHKSDEVNPRQLFESLLRKRKAFSHENEVRLMYCAKTIPLDQEGLFWYDVDPKSMITQIMADPNRNREDWTDEKEKIQSKTKFCGEIKRSKIYDAPDW